MPKIRAMRRAIQLQSPAGDVHTKGYVPFHTSCRPKLCTPLFNWHVNDQVGLIAHLATCQWGWEMGRQQSSEDKALAMNMQLMCTCARGRQFPFPPSLPPFPPAFHCFPPLSTDLALSCYCCYSLSSQTTVFCTRPCIFPSNKNIEKRVIDFRLCASETMAFSCCT